MSDALTEILLGAPRPKPPTAAPESTMGNRIFFGSGGPIIVRMPTMITATEIMGV